VSSPYPDRNRLRELYRLPPGLLETVPHDLASVLGGPTLIHLPGDREPPLFVSVLLHGNEPVGWNALRSLLTSYRQGFGTRQLPRALSLFIGNVVAAAAGVRQLPDQPDYNRVWPGSESPPTPEHVMMRQVVAAMHRRGIFASVDIHSNTGYNPHYGCVNILDNRYLHLATLFSRTVVYFMRPLGVQSIAMGRLGPAVTLECGKVGEQRGEDHARAYLDACLHLSTLPQHPVATGDLDLFHTVAQVKIPETLSFGFPPGRADILFDPELERFNFRELPRGTVLGRVDPSTEVGLEVRDEQGRDVGSRYFSVVQEELRLKRPLIPSMLTREEAIVRQDCLCYIMERYNDRLP